MTTLYGIKNCDTVRAARKWLEANGIDYQFHDFRDDGLGKELMHRFLECLDWEALLNRRSRTWKTLPAEQRESVDIGSAVELMLEHPTLVKRPVLDTGSECHVGFKPDQYQTLFTRHKL